MMTDEQRDALLLRLEAKVDGLDSKVDGLVIYVKAMAHKLLAPAEIAEIEEKVCSAEQENVPA